MFYVGSNHVPAARSLGIPTIEESVPEFCLPAHPSLGGLLRLANSRLVGEVGHFAITRRFSIVLGCERCFNTDDQVLSGFMA